MSERPAGQPPAARDQDASAWSDGALGYDAEFAPVTGAYAEVALDLLELRPGQRLLDVAAGSGAVSLRAARRGVDVLATDFAPGMVQLLESRADAEPGLTARVTARVMDGQALELADASVDAAVSMFGLIFFPDLDVGARELRRVVRPGGRVVVGGWRVEGFRLMDLNRLAFEAVLGDALPAGGPPTWARVGDERGMASLLSDAAFADVEVHVVTRHFSPSDPRSFFLRQPEWAPPAQPLFATMDEAVIERAADEFARLVTGHRDGRGIPFDAVLGLGVVPPSA